MEFEILDEEMEELLKVIISSQKDKKCDLSILNNIFKGLSDSEDALLRSKFKYLKDAGYIETFWASNKISKLNVLYKGNSYFDRKKKYEEKIKKEKINHKWELILSACGGSLITFIISNRKSIFEFISNIITYVFNWF